MTLTAAIDLACEALLERGTDADRKAVAVLEKKVGKIRQQTAQRREPEADCSAVERRLKDAEVYTDLGNIWCRCGSAKARKQSHCTACYHRLPGPLKRALYRREGYQWAYEASLDFLGTHPSAPSAPPRETL